MAAADARQFEAPRLVMLPGLATDARMYEPQRVDFPRLEVPSQLEPRSEEPLAEFARRVAACVDPTPPYFFGGTSLGGMVALEAAQHLDPPPVAVLMIASCRTGEAVRTSLQWGAQVLSALPAPLSKSLYAVPLAIGVLQDLPPQYRELFINMFIDTPPQRIRWATPAIIAWRGPARVPCPVHHVHGANDHVIPVAGSGADVVVPDAGHALSLTHAVEVDQLLRDWMAEDLQQWAGTTGEDGRIPR